MVMQMVQIIAQINLWLARFIKMNSPQARVVVCKFIHPAQRLVEQYAE